MIVSRREFLSALTAGTATAALAACGARRPTSAASTTQAAQTDPGEFKALALDMKAWHHDGEHDVWWQVGLAYCTKPASTTYEKLGIFVPGPYLKPKDDKADLSSTDASKTYECELNAEGTQGQFTCSTAPIVLPVNAPEFSAQAAPTSYLYDGLEPYLKAGLVYVYAGFRGRSNGYDSSSSGEGFFSGGAPWAVTDLKAAVRYLRFNAAVLPGATSRIVTFGHAAGGLLSAVMGASGNAKVYEPYLSKIGAATLDASGASVGDETSAAMCWCPEPAASMADAAYEWGVGQFGADGTRAEGTWTRLMSDDLAASYASYVNGLSIPGDDGKALALDETDGGVFTDGTYYEMLVSMVESSAAKFLNETAFPYTFDHADQTSGAFPGSGVENVETPSVPSALTSDAAPVTSPATVLASGGNAAEVLGATTAAATAEGAGAAVTGEVATPDAAAPVTSPADDQAATTAAAAVTPDASVAPSVNRPAPTTYASRTDYVAALNANGRWLTYNETRGTVRISGLSDYVRECRQPFSGVLSYDATGRSTVTNQLFGNDDNDTLHFSQNIADLLSRNSEKYAQAGGWDAKLPGDWAGDLSKTDSLEQSMGARRNMYDPLYYVAASSEGFGQASVAPHWRINVGLGEQSAPISPSVNLARVLKTYDGVKDVAFTPVWGVGRVLAEVGGADPAGALVSWVGSLFPPDAATTGA